MSAWPSGSIMSTVLFMYVLFQVTDPNVCQVRLDFLEFKMSSPSMTSLPFGQCSEDQFAIFASQSKLSLSDNNLLCGNMTGQHSENTRITTWYWPTRARRPNRSSLFPHMMSVRTSVTDSQSSWMSEKTVIRWEFIFLYIFIYFNIFVTVYLPADATSDERNISLFAMVGTSSNITEYIWNIKIEQIDCSVKNELQGLILNPWVPFTQYLVSFYEGHLVMTNLVAVPLLLGTKIITFIPLLNLASYV